MNAEKIKEKIKELLNNVNNTIPVAWDEVYINSSISETGGHVYFFFKAVDDEKIHYSLNIPEEFKVSEEIFDSIDVKNYTISRELWNIFNDSNIAIWKNLSIVYKNKTLNTYFDYVDWNRSKFGPTDRINYFKYRFIGFKPRTEKESQKFKEMEEYQKQFE